MEFDRVSYFKYLYGGSSNYLLLQMKSQLMSLRNYLYLNYLYLHLAGPAEEKPGSDPHSPGAGFCAQPSH